MRAAAGRRGRLAVLVGLVVATLTLIASAVGYEELVATHAEPEDSGSWWRRLSEQSMLDMPSAFAFGVAVPLVVLLMIVTHLIAAQHSRAQERPPIGPRASWLTATTIILAISGLGIYYGLDARFGPGRYAMLFLGGLVYLLFVVDGIPEGERIGLWRRPWSKGP